MKRSDPPNPAAFRPPKLAPGMKPGDHPDFYRFPPPPGRSRESQIVLDARGRFWNEGQPMLHPGMQRAFASWVRLHPDDGRFILSNGYDWTYFTVEDAPFFVRTVDFRGEQPWLTLTDDSEEPLDPSGVLVGDDDVLYVRVRGGAYEAKLLPSAQAAMVNVLDEGPDGRIVARVGGTSYPLAQRRAPGSAPAAGDT